MTELFSFDRVLRVLGELGGECVGTAPQRGIAACTIDSRECLPDSLFFALPGTRTDGHAFVGDAFDRGASAAVVAKSFTRLNLLRQELAARGSGALCIVESPLGVLQKLAAAYLDDFPELIRIGVTGSNGKTTTKELIAALLSEAAPTYRSSGNYNSVIGLPLAAFGVRSEHRYAVFELALNNAGQIPELASICRPHHACITNIGSAHIGHIGSRDSIAEEKRGIFSQFDGGQTGYVHEDEPYREFLLKGLRGKAVLFGERSTSGFELLSSEGLHGSVVRVGGREARLAIPGAHNFANACCAVAVARELDLEDKHIAAGLEKARTLFGRSEFIHGDVSVYQDCYNANPESMQALFELIERTDWKDGKTIVVLGSMKELGESTAEAHRAIAKQAISTRADRVVFVGPEFENALNGSIDTAHWYSDVDELERSLPELVGGGDLVVLKGSRSAGLERLVPYLQGGNR